MSPKMFTMIAAAALLASIAPARADRLILGPTGGTLGVGDVRAEGAFDSSDDRRILFLNVGLPKVELSDQRLDNGKHLVGAKTADIVTAQLGVLPETTFTPGLAVGVWDVGNASGGGRGYYMAFSKRVPWKAPSPIPLRDVKLHIGFGLAGIDGPFGGLEASMSDQFKVYAERFNGTTNFALGWKVLKGVETRASILDGRPFWGVQISSMMSSAW